MKSKSINPGPGIFCVLAVVAALNIYGQTTNEPVICTTTHDEAGAISLRWESETNAIYRIEYANFLETPMNWQTLYDDYPSHGTNTLWTDAGQELYVPDIAHPRDKGWRFYRVVKINTNANLNASISFLALTNDSILSSHNWIGVSANSTSYLAGIRLFIDGHELDEIPASETNFYLNTHEWRNGTHVLFSAVAANDGWESTDNDSNLQVGYSLTPLINVSFDNYVSQFRHQYLDSEQTTQKLSAAFPAYSDWTLYITNSDAALVRTATGSGYGLEYVWDGRDDTGQEVAIGFYLAAVEATATTAPSPPEPGSTNWVPSPMGFSAVNRSLMPTSPAQALALGLNSYFIMPPPMPPFYERLYGTQPPIEVPIPQRYYGLKQKSIAIGSPIPMGANSAGGSGAKKILKGTPGTIGIASQGHHPSGKDLNATWPGPWNGLNGYVILESEYTLYRPYGELKNPSKIARGFSKGMNKSGWKTQFNLKDDDLKAAHLRAQTWGGSNVFNNVNLAPVYELA
ncbi:MAG: hypothetical protein WCO56_22120 [Verrucomicrobiota bacterium]